MSESHIKWEAELIRTRKKPKGSWTKVFAADRRLADAIVFISEALTGTHQKDGAAVERFTRKVKITVSYAGGMKPSERSRNASKKNDPLTLENLTENDESKDKVALVCNYVKALYESPGGGAGGGGHIVFDDGNLEDGNIDYCINFCLTDESTMDDETRIASIMALVAVRMIPLSTREKLYDQNWATKKILPPDVFPMTIFS